MCTYYTHMYYVVFVVPFLLCHRSSPPPPPPASGHETQRVIGRARRKDDNARVRRM